MTRTAYPSDLTDSEWQILEPLIPPAKPGGRPRSIDMREVFNGIFYILRGGCAWRMLPHDFPKWKTVYDYFRTWRNEGVWEELNRQLREQRRVHIRREAQPSAAIIDSQSVKTTEVGGVKGYDGGKKVKGRKRHLLVDTQGFVLAVLVLAANVSNPAGGKQLLGDLRGRFRRLHHLFIDGGYKRGFQEWVSTTLGWTLEVVQLTKSCLRQTLMPGFEGSGCPRGKNSPLNK